LADIFRLHGPDYLAKFKGDMLPSHRRAMQDIIDCRTEILGGQVYLCEPCDDFHFSYHSCKNRHCPKCDNDKATEWLENQNGLLLPVVHFLVTFTLPHELRKLARSNQKTVYNIFFRTSAEAFQQLCLDPKFVGGEIGMMGVLQTWTRDLIYHPHIHYVATGGGLSADGERWLASRENFLVPVKALSVIFCAKFRDELKKTDLFDQVPAAAWKKSWVVHSEPVGSGKQALKYLAPYLFRVAISNNRIRKLKDGMVTFKYKDSDTGSWRLRTLPAEEFIRRFLQHILPQRFIKIRYYGLGHPHKRHELECAKELLHFKPETREKSQEIHKENNVFRCPKCGGVMIVVDEIKSQRRRAPPDQAVRAI
jgi:hypothetical protein